jgi:carbamoyltransferase
VLEEEATAWFDLAGPSRYMTFTHAVLGDRLPAVTHVDGTARVQTVRAAEHPELHRILAAFAERTECPVLLNTSFNGPGEPIVASPADALDTFVRSGADLLVIEGCVVNKADLRIADRTEVVAGASVP